jgi:hypothetical protein
MDKFILKIYMEKQASRISKQTLKKMANLGGLSLPAIRTSFTAIALTTEVSVYMWTKATEELTPHRDKQICSGDYFFFRHMGFEFKILALAKWAFYHLSHATSPFCFSYFFGDRVLEFMCRQA